MAKTRKPSYRQVVRELETSRSHETLLSDKVDSLMSEREETKEIAGRLTDEVQEIRAGIQEHAHRRDELEDSLIAQERRANDAFSEVTMLRNALNFIKRTMKLANSDPQYVAQLAYIVACSPESFILPMNSNVNDGMAKVLEVLRTGSKIQAIKEYRTHTGAGLLESKNAVEALGLKHGIVPPHTSGELSS